MDFDNLLNKIVCMDALDLLKALPDESIDMVLCDLPYGVTACAWDIVIPIEPMWTELKRVVKQRAAIVLTATQPFTSRLVSSNYEMFKYEWLWRKSRPSNFVHANNMPLTKYESVLVFSKASMGHESLLGDKRMNYYPQGLKKIDLVVTQNVKTRARWDGVRPSHQESFTQEYTNYPTQELNFASVTGAVHPTQKPVALFEYLIRTYTVENDIVLDMTCGSGTTAIAARKTGRRFICGDNSPEYVELANKRLQNTDPYQDTILDNGYKQLSMFSKLKDDF